MFSGCNPYTDFVVTKAVGNSGGLQAEAFTNEKGVRKAKVGDYNVPILSSIPSEREEQLKIKKNIISFVYLHKYNLLKECKEEVIE